MSDRNKLLIDLASAIGIADDLTGKSRNEILESIASAYGGVFVNTSRNELLRATDAAVNGSSGKKSRNKYIRAIAEGLGATGLNDDLSRNALLSHWLSNAVPVVTTWILLAGTWNDLGKWDDSATWNDGV